MWVLRPQSLPIDNGWWQIVRLMSGSSVATNPPGLTNRVAIPSDDDYGRSQSSRLSAAIRDGWARCPERMGRLFGFVDPGDIALFGTDGGRTWTRFDATAQRPLGESFTTQRSYVRAAGPQPPQHAIP